MTARPSKEGAAALDRLFLFSFLFVFLAPCIRFFIVLLKLSLLRMMDRNVMSGSQPPTGRSLGVVQIVPVPAGGTKKCAKKRAARVRHGFAMGVPVRSAC